ncbi:MAG: hypothetical protein WD119_00645 [Pirellulaceae bacterium]
MNQSENLSSFFRCPVQSECAEATLHVARAKIPAKLQEQSIDGFTVTVDAAKAPKLRFGKPWVLATKHDRVEVHAEWIFNAFNGDVQMALRRVKDLNEVENRASRWNPFARRRESRRNGQGAMNEIAFAGVVVFIFAVLSLPGLGDAVGTAPHIQKTAGEVGQMAGKVIRSLW